jgi:hypothetical protein
LTVLNISVQNAFSALFRKLGYNYYEMFGLDVLHEFELGVWKMILVHLIRVLDSLPENRLHLLDQRFVPNSRVPVFDSSSS